MSENLLKEPLPEPWSFGVTQDGRIFFINDTEERTTWLHPVTKTAVSTGYMEGKDLPIGWEKGYTVDGTEFYINHNNQSTAISFPKEEDGIPNIDKEEEVGVKKKKRKPSFTETFTRPLFRRSTSKARDASDKKTRTSRSRSRDSRTGDLGHQQTAPTLTRKTSIKIHVRRRDTSLIVIKQGWLYKQQSSGMKTWRKRWFLLSDFCLFYYKDSSENEILGSILLPSYSVTTVLPEDKVTRKYSFKICHSGMRTFFVSAESYNDMAEWVQVLTPICNMQDKVVDACNVTDVTHVADAVDVVDAADTAEVIEATAATVATATTTATAVTDATDAVEATSKSKTPEPRKDPKKDPKKDLKKDPRKDPKKDLKKDQKKDSKKSKKTNRKEELTADEKNGGFEQLSGGKTHQKLPRNKQSSPAGASANFPKNSNHNHHQVQPQTAHVVSSNGSARHPQTHVDHPRSMANKHLQQPFRAPTQQQQHGGAMIGNSAPAMVRHPRLPSSSHSGGSNVSSSNNSRAGQPNRSYNQLPNGLHYSSQFVDTNEYQQQGPQVQKGYQVQQSSQGQQVYGQQFQPQQVQQFQGQQFQSQVQLQNWMSRKQGGGMEFDNSSSVGRNPRASSTLGRRQKNYATSTISVPAHHRHQQRQSRMPQMQRSPSQDVLQERRQPPSYGSTAERTRSSTYSSQLNLAAENPPQLFREPPRQSAAPQYGARVYKTISHASGRNGVGVEIQHDTRRAAKRTPSFHNAVISKKSEKNVEVKQVDVKRADVSGNKLRAFAISVKKPSNNVKAGANLSSAGETKEEETKTDYKEKMKRLGQLKDVSDDITMKMEVIKEENAEIRSSIQVAKTESNYVDLIELEDKLCANKKRKIEVAKILTETTSELGEIEKDFCQRKSEVLEAYTKSLMSQDSDVSSDHLDQKLKEIEKILELVKGNKFELGNLMDFYRDGSSSSGGGSTAASTNGGGHHGAKITPSATNYKASTLRRRRNTDRMGSIADTDASMESSLTRTNSNESLNSRSNNNQAEGFTAASLFGGNKSATLGRASGASTLGRDRTSAQERLKNSNSQGNLINANDVKRMQHEISQNMLKTLTLGRSKKREKLKPQWRQEQQNEIGTDFKRAIKHQQMPKPLQRIKRKQHFNTGGTSGGVITSNSSTLPNRRPHSSYNVNGFDLDDFEASVQEAMGESNGLVKQEEGKMKEDDLPAPPNDDEINEVESELSSTNYSISNQLMTRDKVDIPDRSVDFNDAPLTAAQERTKRKKIRAIETMLSRTGHPLLTHNIHLAASIAVEAGQVARQVAIHHQESYNDGGDDDYLSSSEDENKTTSSLQPSFV